MEIQLGWFSSLQYSFILIVSFISAIIICFSLYLLRILKNRCNFECTSTLFVYLHSLLLGCIGLSIQYALLLFSPSICRQFTNLSSTDFIFWTGLIPGSLIPATPITVLFLSIDRFLIILLPIHSQKLIVKRGIALGSVLSVLSIFLLNFCVNLVEKPTEEEPECISFGCLSSDASRLVYGINRVLVALPNFISGTFFLAVLFAYRRRLEQSQSILVNALPASSNSNQRTNSRKISDRLALWVVLFEFLLDLLPNLIYFILTTLDINISAYVGAFRSVTYSICAFCSALSHTTLLRRIFASRIVSVDHAVVQIRSAPPKSQF